MGTTILVVTTQATYVLKIHTLIWVYIPTNILCIVYSNIHNNAIEILTKYHFISQILYTENAEQCLIYHLIIYYIHRHHIHIFHKEH